MRVVYPKSPDKIKIKQTRISLEFRVSVSHKTSMECTLAEILTNYLLHLGYSNIHVLGIIIQLLTKGKVRVEFHDYVERFELLDPNDKISRTQAVSLFDDHVAVKPSDDEGQLSGHNVTQRIVVQQPRKSAR